MLYLGDIPASHSWILATMLIATRMGALLLLAPPLSSGFVPASVRVAVVLALAACLATLPAIQSAAIPGLGELLAAFATEAALGATMALGVSLAFAAFSIAGRLLDVQIGFGIGQVFDPQSQQQLPVLSSAFSLLAIVLLFTLDAHHALLQGFTLSLEVFPLGEPWSPARFAPALLKQVASSFSLGFGMVAPVVLCLFLVELVLGVLSRNMPQMNMFALAIPIKVVIGIAALSLSVVAIGPIASRVNSAIFKGWEAAFR